MTSRIVFFAALAAGCGTGSAVDVAQHTEALTLGRTDNILQVDVTTTGPLTQGVNDTFAWTVTNVSAFTVNNVGVGSNWTDADGGAPIVKALAPGCGTQGASILGNIAALGIWCGSQSGTNLAPGQSVSGWATLEDTAVGPVKYNMYGSQIIVGGDTVEVPDNESALPGAVDLQISGSSNQGSPPLDSLYTYTFQVKNAGPWATAGGVTFSDPLPPMISFVSMATTPAATCTSGQAVTCALPDLANGASATIAITVRAPNVQETYANSATVSLTSPQADTNSANNSLTVTVQSK